MNYFGAAYGPAAPPRDDLTRALQQKMIVLGYSPSIGGVYGASEDAVVQSYADQLGIDASDRLDLNSVIAQVLPVMDADIEVSAQWKQPKPGTTLTTTPLNISGRLAAPAPAKSGGMSWLLLAAAGAYLYFKR